MTNTQDFDVFISYSSVDAEWVAKIREALRAEGLSVWQDQTQVRPGSILVRALESVLESSKAMALIISPESMDSGWVEEEYSLALKLAQARHLSCQIIPVLLRKTRLPGFLSNRIWVDFTDENNFRHSLERLIWGITGKEPHSLAAITAAHRIPYYVEDFMVLDPLSVLEDQTLGDAQSALGEKNPPYLVVRKTRKGPMTGFITKGTIAAAKPPSVYRRIGISSEKYQDLLHHRLSQPIKNHMIPLDRLIWMSPQDTIETTLDKFTKLWPDEGRSFRVRAIPIKDDSDQPLGVIGYWNLIDGLLQRGYIPKKPVRNYQLSPDEFYYAHDYNTIQEVEAACISIGAAHIPIVDDEFNLLGMVSVETIRHLIDSSFEQLYDDPVVMYMREFRLLRRLTGEEMLDDVSVFFARSRSIGALPVVEDTKLRGLLTYVEALTAVKR